MLCRCEHVATSIDEEITVNMIQGCEEDCSNKSLILTTYQTSDHCSEIYSILLWNRVLQLWKLLSWWYFLLGYGNCRPWKQMSSRVIYQECASTCIWPTQCAVKCFTVLWKKQHNGQNNSWWSFQFSDQWNRTGLSVFLLLSFKKIHQQAHPFNLDWWRFKCLLNPKQETLLLCYCSGLLCTPHPYLEVALFTQ